MPIHRRGIIAAALAALLVVVLGSAFLILRSADDDESGIRGRVLAGCLGASCPPTPSAPTVGLQLVRRWTEGVKAGEEFPLVRRFWSAKDGTFEVPLRPGHYLIEEDPNSPAEGQLYTQDVFVREGEFTKVNLFYGQNRG
jgi:hypothetical protein